jgi:hypothetical protein
MEKIVERLYHLAVSPSRLTHVYLLFYVLVVIPDYGLVSSSLDLEERPNVDSLGDHQRLVAVMDSIE